MAPGEILMTKERAASLIFFLVGIYGLIFGIKLPLGTWRDPGPGVLPLGLSILLLASGFMWYIFGGKKGGGKKKEQEIGWAELSKNFVTPLKIVGTTITFIFLMETIGYLLASSIYVFILFSWISRYRLWAAVGLALIIGAGTWFFFGKILAVPLPRGLLNL